MTVFIVGIVLIILGAICLKNPDLAFRFNTLGQFKNPEFVEPSELTKLSIQVSGGILLGLGVLLVFSV